MFKHRDALRGTPGSVCPQPEPRTPLSCPIAPPFQRELLKDGGGGGSGVARRARAARVPKAKSCAASFTCSSLTCSSFTCHLRASVGARVCLAWVLGWQMAMDKINAFTMSIFTLPSFVAPSSSCVESFTCVLHMSPKGKRGGTSVFTCIERAYRPMAAWGAACMCWACLKMGGETSKQPFKEGQTDRWTDRCRGLYDRRLGWLLSSSGAAA